MADISLDFLGQKIEALIVEVRAMRAELTAMRVPTIIWEPPSTDGRVEGLRRIVDAQGQRITALEKGARK